MEGQGESVKAQEWWRGLSIDDRENLIDKYDVAYPNEKVVTWLYDQEN